MIKQLKHCVLIAALVALAGAAAGPAGAHTTSYVGHGIGGAQQRGQWMVAYEGYAEPPSRTGRGRDHEHLIGHYYSRLSGGFYTFRHRYWKLIFTSVFPAKGPTDDPGDYVTVWPWDPGAPDWCYEFFGKAENPCPVRPPDGATMDGTSARTVLSDLQTAGYDVRLVRLQRTNRQPELIGADGVRPRFENVGLATLRPGDCVTAVGDADLSEFPLDRPTRYVSLEIADRSTARAVGHGCKT